MKPWNFRHSTVSSFRKKWDLGQKKECDANVHLQFESRFKTYILTQYITLADLCWMSKMALKATTFFLLYCLRVIAVPLPRECLFPKAFPLSVVAKGPFENYVDNNRERSNFYKCLWQFFNTFQTVFQNNSLSIYWHFWQIVTYFDSNWQSNDCFWQFWASFEQLSYQLIALFSHIFWSGFKKFLTTWFLNIPNRERERERV